MQGKETINKMKRQPTDWEKTFAKDVTNKGLISKIQTTHAPCLFNLYAEYIMCHDGLDEAQAGIKFLGEISITSDMQMTPSLW